VNHVGNCFPLNIDPSYHCRCDWCLCVWKAVVVHEMLWKSFGSPLIINNGITIAKEIELPDPNEDIGVQLVYFSSLFLFLRIKCKGKYYETEKTDLYK